MSQITLSPPRQPHRFKLNPKRRRLIFGMTGFGKTVWGRYLNRAWYRANWQILIVDQDGKYVDEDQGETYAKKPEEATVASPWDITKSGKIHPTARVMIFHPEIPGWHDERFLALMDEAFERGNIVLDFDDLYGVVEGYHIPVILRKLWTSGRKKSIPIQARIQSARGFDKIIMRQSEDIDVFFMQDADEREYLAHALGHTKLKEAAPQFCHWSYVVGELEVVLVGALPQHEVR